ncbi:cobalt/magnesium uptake transporter [Legionella geestiana]|uniref:Magnesium transport protein CorA n=1 Tax=Legionella geestiana TaxID=45065 RepID=A0A0W0TNX8_9GAMM|nr:magnesium/cobalt transporter CorA [Legionella geestiana]KTC97298.1 cobalt/magnesium uptake transporter [Legionella geestiana]QBS12426.1 magnesium/cobalt transporter CorA [Legionella geestiana]QDQ39860.1 magnesium/cobalt transporter CorA [Legionella geestiana]STX55133.1 metal ion transporter, MIT family [Legionella geestiana]
MHKHRKQSSAKLGMLPGSPVYVGEKPPNPTTIQVYIYDASHCEHHTKLSMDALFVALDAGQHVWVDVAGLGDAALITRLCNDFGIHPLITEDILNTGQRPKLDAIGDYLFIVMKRLDMKTEGLTYHTEQCSLVVKNNLVLTFRESPLHDFALLSERLRAEHSLVRAHGSDYLTYLLLDSMVDEYFNFVENTGSDLEAMEDLLTREPDSLAIDELYMLKRRTQVLRKAIAPLRDIVHLLLEEHVRKPGDSFDLYYQDLHDHCLRLLESVDMHREIIGSMLEIYHSTLNNRMNETIKVLTLFASIFIPLTFVAGVYGMNFQYMPELGWRYGYPMVLGFMALLVVLMLYYFRRKKLL